MQNSFAIRVRLARASQDDAAARNEVPEFWVFETSMAIIPLEREEFSFFRFVTSWFLAWSKRSSNLADSVCVCILLTLVCARFWQQHHLDRETRSEHRPECRPEPDRAMNPSSIS